MRTPRAYSRAERKTMVKTAFAINYQKHIFDNLTMYQLARKLDMRPSGHLMSILMEMVGSGDLTMHIERINPNWNRYLFELTPGTFTAPKKSHNIAINVQGKAMGLFEALS